MKFQLLIILIIYTLTWLIIKRLFFYNCMWDSLSPTVLLNIFNGEYFCCLHTKIQGPSFFLLTLKWLTFDLQRIEKSLPTVPLLCEGGTHSSTIAFSNNIFKLLPLTLFLYLSIYLSLCLYFVSKIFSCFTISFIHSVYSLSFKRLYSFYTSVKAFVLAPWCII